jgi:hypothetical protein
LEFSSYKVCGVMEALMCEWQEDSEIREPTAGKGSIIKEAR